ncbi:hypothetical protein TOPH_05491 [Tolypocladium ophioglossoides CBS 100239]|uniref:Uncharacterized protein n=1 Tax=Tolypocladium ophioglossoides (strain CBS 100239) TaxID=1163406 RepID=A0A0L0N6Y5_TOLOC|nr:hypothetical protein TOPH_05491 [Tolypocladium ophioglossoides CBS 100239]
MKLLSILLGLGLAGVGLAAPAAGPYQVITTEDGIPLMRSRVVRVDAADVNTPNTPSSPCFLSTKLSKYASDALGLMRLPGRKFRLSPVFALDADSAGVMTDPNGDLVTVSYGGRRKGMAWRHPGKDFHPYPMLSLRDCLPFLILAISLSVVVACSFLRRSVYKRELEPAFESALAEKGIRPQGTERSRSMLEKQPASTARATMDCL